MYFNMQQWSHFWPWMAQEESFASKLFDPGSIWFHAVLDDEDEVAIVLGDSKNNSKSTYYGKGNAKTGYRNDYFLYKPSKVFFIETQ